MDEYILAWRWLAHAAVGGLIVLGPGESRGAALPPARAACPGRRPHAAGSVRRPMARRFCPLRRGGPRVSFWQLPRPWRRPRARCGRFRRRPLRPLRSSSTQGRSLASVAARGRVGPSSVPRVRLPKEGDESDLGRRGWPRFSWEALALTAYAAVSAGLAGWWLLGQILLWRITRVARPVPPEIHEVFREISGPAGRCGSSAGEWHCRPAVHLHLGTAGDRAALRRSATEEIPRSCGSAWRTSGRTSSAATPAPGTSRPSPGSCCSISPCSGGCGGN